jgi:replication factor A1
MLFNERGTSLLGKLAEKLVKQYGRFDTPPEIRALVGEKITVVVKVMPPKSAAKSDEDPTFDILNIKKRHGKDFIDCGFKKE